MTAIRAALALAALFLLPSIRTAGADSRPQGGAPIESARPMHGSLAFTWPANGAADGEALDARIERLRLALRLSEAERTVKRGRVKR